MLKTLNTRTATALAALLLTTTAAVSQEHRELDAHVHGVSTLEVALEDGTLTMNLHSPGMDIVGFEHAASSEGDKDAVAAAIRTFSQPELLFGLPDGAECRLAEVLAHLHDGKHDHEETDAHAAHEEGGHHDEDEEHAHEEETHEGEAHADEAHADEAHDHDAHEGEAGGHSEFHARYEFACDHPDELETVDLTFFEVFPNAEEVEATIVTEAGASKAEIGRDDATLSLR